MRGGIRLALCALLALSASAVLSGTAGAAKKPNPDPGVPTGLRGVPRYTSLTISWTPPSSSGAAPISSYKTAGNLGSPASSCSAATTSCTVTGLKPGKTYSIKIRAVNADNDAGPFTRPISVKVGIPDPPTVVTGQSGNASALVSWVRPALNGNVVTGYTATADPGGQTCTATGSPPPTACTVNGLRNGTAYSFTVTSTDPFGVSVPSSASPPVVPMTVPGAPIDVTAVGYEDAQASVSWTAPDDGGSTPTYTVTADPGGASCATVTTTCTVSGLTNGQAYTFTVIATNVVGSGPVSSPSAPAIPSTAPGAPTGVAVTSPASGSATVTWGPPVDDGGNAVAGYVVTATPGGATCRQDDPATSSCTVSGLSATTAYTFVVTADNPSGTGPGGYASLFVPGCVPAPRAELAGCDFTDLDLSGFDFDRSDLTGANFTDADLTDADLAYDTLNNVTLDGADLTGALLYTNGNAYDGLSATGTTFPTGFTVVDSYLVGPGVDISGVDFSGGDFTGAVLNHGSLDDDNFTGADLSGVDLDRTDLTGSNFTDADLTDADLAYDTLNNVTLDGADLTGDLLYTNGNAYDGLSATGTTFPTGFTVVDSYLVGPGVDISGVDFSGGDFTGAVLNHGSLDDDNFTGADLSGVDLDRTDLTGSNFTDADLTDADLAYDTLNNVTLDGADLAGALFYTNGNAYDGLSATGTTFPTGFTVVDSYLVGPGVDISGVDFSGGDFTGAVLNHGSLDDDNFTGADLSGVDLDRTDLTGSNFTDADLTDADLGYDTLNNVNLDGADLAGAFLYISGYGYDGVSAVGTTLPAGFAVVSGYLIGPGAVVSGADLSGDDFEGAMLNTATLTSDNLQGSDLDGVDFDQTDLTGSNLAGASLSGAIWDATICPDATNSSDDNGTCANNL